MAARSPLPTPTATSPYAPPSWARGALRAPPNGRFTLANLPTPLHRICSFPNSLTASRSSNARQGILRRLGELGITLYVKRDDATGGPELGGNKIRKLEFLLADALAKGRDAVVTIGGEQSNHCRATASAARAVGMEPHLILRTRRADDVEPLGGGKFGYVGNVLFDRMVGSTIYTCTPAEYGMVGSNELTTRVCKYISQSMDGKPARNPYPIPVGGSNGIGTWGYINGVDELMGQLDDARIALDHVVFASGSGGTAAGITLGLALAHGAATSSDAAVPKIHAVGVCDTPDYFYDTVTEIAREMDLSLPENQTTSDFVRRFLTVHQGKGKGYAWSSQEELDFVSEFAMETGIVLDPVYSGKALYHFVTKVVEDDPESFRGKNILFWHTGGALGMYDKGDALLGRMAQISPVKRLDVDGTGGRDSVPI